MLPPLAQNPKGEFRQIEFSPPLTLQVGDEVLQVGSQLTVIRAGVVVATRTLSGIGSVVDGPVQAEQEVSSVLYFRSYPVAGVIVTLIDVIKNNTTGTIRFKFANGSDREFPDFTSILSDASSISIEGIDSTPALAENMLILKTIRNSPDGANLENMIGASVAIDFNANVPVVMTVD